MMSRKKAGVLRRLLGALGGFLKRGFLGKSSHGYMKQFADTGEWRGNASAPPDGDLERRSRRPGTVRQDAEREFEPVHGWTRRQRDDYLGRNPGYRARYDAALRQFRDATGV
jgi:hypothetical protein